MWICGDGSSSGAGLQIDVEAVAGKEETNVEAADEERRRRWVDGDRAGTEECDRAGKQQNVKPARSVIREQVGHRNMGKGHNTFRRSGKLWAGAHLDITRASSGPP